VFVAEGSGPARPRHRDRAEISGQIKEVLVAKGRAARGGTDLEADRSSRALIRPPRANPNLTRAEEAAEPRAT